MMSGQTRFPASRWPLFLVAMFCLALPLGVVLAQDSTTAQPADEPAAEPAPETPEAETPADDATPAETQVDATLAAKTAADEFVHALSAGQYGDAWQLLAPETQSRLGRELQELKEVLNGLPADRRNRPIPALRSQRPSTILQMNTQDFFAWLAGFIPEPERQRMGEATADEATVIPPDEEGAEGSAGQRHALVTWRFPEHMAPVQDMPRRLIETPDGWRIILETN